MPSKIRKLTKSFSVPLSIVLAVPLLLSAESAQELLARADRLADQGNWSGAAPFYIRAEAEFHKSGDKRNEIYSRFGRLHQTVEAGSYRAVRTETDADASRSRRAK